ncbi:hypothetical protein CUMW_250040 [Citrus unshiu]|uniref:Uncharacterized protein n=1 Tax=Citrus unshiu TaxID=55188 RepID=A0A2H5QPQ1_CITUN|nr:hypothetical protein CUMW_250040 [Citrus unshiu]
MAWKFRLSSRSNFASSRACRSQAARLLSCLIDSKSSTWATPTILLIILAAPNPRVSWNRSFINFSCTSY